MSAALLQREALRQQMLLRALWRDARPGVVEGWLRQTPTGKRRGLAAYQANAGALAERALAAAFPTIAQLLGGAAFAALARAFWHAHAPACGDIAEWGGALPGFIAGDDQLASEPYLADVARLDWAVHQAERAADDALPVRGLDLLGSVDPAGLRLQLRAGTALVVSAHPVVSIWLAHRSTRDDRFDVVRAAFAEGRSEAALVRRHGLVARVVAVDAAAARFVAALLDRQTLGRALDLAGSGFDFEAWLIDTLRLDGLAAVDGGQPQDPT